MKTLLLFPMMLCLLLPAKVVEHCDYQHFIYRCMRNQPEGYTYLKSYHIRPQSSSQRLPWETSYLLSKGIIYMVQLADNGSEAGDEDQSMSVVLYDQARNEVARSYRFKTAGRGLIFNCQRTGIYYLSFPFKKSDGHYLYCGGAVLSFKREQD